MFYYDFGDFHVVGASPEILSKEGAAVTLAHRGHAPRVRRERPTRISRRSLGDPQRNRRA
jgi:hypothetical protein